MSTAGTAVSAIRSAAEMTPGDLAKAAGIDLALLHKLEAGDEDGVSTADVACLARVLRVDPIDLMTGKATAASSPTVYFLQSAYPDFYDVDRMKLLDALDRAHALVAIDLVLARGLGLRGLTAHLLDANVLIYFESEAVEQPHQRALAVGCVSQVPSSAAPAPFVRPPRAW